MNKALGTLFATALTAAMLTLTAGPASAAHCTDTGPGHSDFGKHAKANGSGEHNEGDHQGWSSCEDQAKSGNR